MVRESADEAALRTALATTAAERDALRAALHTVDTANADLRRQAQVANQAKADFMARMTHEMRTPLSAIIGLANLALQHPHDAATEDSLAKIRQSAKALLAVVDDITDFSRLEKGLVDVMPVPFDLAQVMETVRSRFAEAARQKGLALSVHQDPAIPTQLVGDHVRLEQILGQLVGNAVKFTETGEVVVDATLIGHHHETVRLDFSVRDTGIGMLQATIPNMLESFTQADGTLSRPYGGTGLGLAIVQRGVSLLGGQLHAESTPGHGTLFSFRIDLQEGSAANAALPERPGQDPALPPLPASPYPLAGSHILLVEDNAINQQVARETLQRFGAAVKVARHGGEAVAMVQQDPYDVVLMDVQMPIMDGLAATRAIRSLPELAELPIVALTAHALAEDRDRCLAAGMNDYLTKPIEPDRLLATLGQWIAPAAAAAAQAARAQDLIIQADQPPAASRPEPLEDPGLDATKALARLGGNATLLRDVVAEFARDYADCAALLRRNVADGDVEAARRLAHTVKGVAGNIAADGLAAHAQDLETILRANDLPGPEALDAFAAALERTLAAADRLQPTRPATPGTPHPASCRILLVDDAKLNRSILGQILKSAGHEVVSVGNGKEACRRLFGTEHQKRPFDCILMDIEMPEMDGLRAAKLIRNILTESVHPPCSPRIPILALTFHEADKERERCRAAGMDDCLPKVYDREKLLATLDRLLTARRPAAAPAGDCGVPAAANPVLETIVRGLGAHLSEGSIRADEDVAALRHALGEQPEPAELTALAEAVARYDFAEAMRCLGRLAKLWRLPPVQAG